MLANDKYSIIDYIYTYYIACKVISVLIMTHMQFLFQPYLIILMISNIELKKQINHLLSYTMIVWMKKK